MSLVVSIPERVPGAALHSSWPHLVKSHCFPSVLLRAIPEANSWPQQSLSNVAVYDQTGAWGVKGPIQGIKNDTAEVGKNFHIPTKQKAKDKR